MTRSVKVTVLCELPIVLQIAKFFIIRAAEDCTSEVNKHQNRKLFADFVMQCVHFFGRCLRVKDLQSSRFQLQVLFVRYNLVDTIALYKCDEEWQQLLADVEFDTIKTKRL